MNILEMKEQRISLQDELKSIIENGEAEKRELNEDETSKLAELRTKIDELNAEIENEERKNIEVKNNSTNTEKKMEKNVRLFDLIKEVVNNNVTDEHRSYINGNEISFRAAIQATTTGHGEENVPVEKQPLEVAIRNASVLNKVGAQWFPSAVGDIKLVKYQGSNVFWADSENADAPDGASGFTEVTLSPKRLTAYITISRQFLAQSPEDAEAILVNDLARAIGEKIDKTVFGVSSGSTAEPAGLFSGDYISTGSDLTAVTFQDVLGLEEAVEEKNGTDFMFVADPSVKYALRGTQLASGLQFVWQNGEIDGRTAVVSNSVAKGGLLCFDPRDLCCATWDNGLNIIVDPFSLAGKNQIKVTVNYLFDSTLKGDRISGAIFE